ncbi:MAG TPA: hypothetical protein VHR45_24770 [Thermoanaerobaculia bacterium]|nr:hypothetical protein [Thermoanaerobaculia bacterium]
MTKQRITLLIVAMALIAMAIPAVATVGGDGTAANKAETFKVLVPDDSGICRPEDPVEMPCVNKTELKDIVPSDVSVTSSTGTCISSDTVLCIMGGRFGVSVIWTKSDGSQGPGHAISLNGGSGTFWFFSSDNSEMLVKMVEGCALGNHWWFFAAATTNVGYAIQVVDYSTTSGNVYTNGVNHPAMPIQDTGAFMCP